MPQMHIALRRNGEEKSSQLFFAVLNFLFSSSFIEYCTYLILHVCEGKNAMFLEKIPFLHLF
jgi:hypothetical protein